MGRGIFLVREFNFLSYWSCYYLIMRQSICFFFSSITYSPHSLKFSLVMCILIDMRCPACSIVKVHWSLHGILLRYYMKAEFIAVKLCLTMTGYFSSSVLHLDTKEVLAFFFSAFFVTGNITSINHMRDHFY
jgi:hypothetical protein